MKNSKGHFFIFIALLLIMAGSKGMAQDTRGKDGFKRFSAGVKTGLNLGDVSYELDTLQVLGLKSSVKSGINAGLIGIVHFTRQFALQVEILYIAKGFRYKPTPVSFFNFSAITPEVNFHLNYIEAPLLARGEIVVSPLKIILAAGPTFSYAINGKYSVGEVSYNGMVLQQAITEKIDFEATGIKRFDLGMTIGLGLAYPVKKGDLLLEARYGRGFTKYRDDRSEPRNTGFNFNFGYILPIGK